MPTYEYRCKKCGENIEVDQKMSDDPLTIHDNCGGELSKVFSSVGIVWKGSGFYKTDSRGSSATSKPKSDADKSSSTESKTESKPDKSSSGDSSKSTEKPAKPTSDSKTNKKQ